MATLDIPSIIAANAPLEAAAVSGDLMSLTNNFIKATVNSLFMILVTEIGDKTFFIAAVLAMRNARVVVYAGAMGKFICHISTSLHKLITFLSTINIRGFNCHACSLSYDGICTAKFDSSYLYPLC